MPSVIQKDPDATLDFAVDWSQWLAEGETITDCTVSVPEGITEAPAGHGIDGAVVFVWLAGGTLDKHYPVTFHITTDQGREDDRTLTIVIRER